MTFIHGSSLMSGMPVTDPLVLLNLNNYVICFFFSRKYREKSQTANFGKQYNCKTPAQGVIRV